MPLLADIQTALLAGQDLSPILLRLRFLAARLGSGVLEEWVRQESEGYPPGVEVPDYRRMSVSYTGSFNGAFGRQVNNLPIPPYVIKELASDAWLTHEERQSISGIEALIAATTESGSNLQIPNASNLVALVADKMLGGMVCHVVTGIISRAALIELQHVLRNRVLELTIQIEAKVPGVTLIEVAQGTTSANPKEYAAVTNIITHNTVYGNQANNNVGDVSGESSLQITVQQGDVGSLEKALKGVGFADHEAVELASLVASEKPDKPNDPIGQKARAWLAANLSKLVDKVGLAAAATVIGDAVAKYYGLS